MANKNAAFNENQKLDEVLSDPFDLDNLEERLQSQLQEELEGLEFLKEEKELIGNPDNLGNIIKDVVWEQFLNQVAVTAGKDFIEENNGLKLDLRNEAHIQTPENFAKGKIATHNYKSKEQLEQNYDRFKNTPHGKFRKEYVNLGMDATLKRAGALKKEGTDTVTDIYTGRQISTHTELENGKKNPEAAQREHVKPSAGLYKDPSLQMANNNEELAATINNPENLQGYTTKERNTRKSDKSSDEMNEYDKTKHWEKADKKADEYIEQKKGEGEDRLKKEGRETQKKETLRIGGKALRAVLMQLLAELVREAISKLVKWFKSGKKTLNILLDSLKEAIHSFIGKMKTHLINAGNTVCSTIATAIIGPVFGTIKKVQMLLKQGWKSLRDALNYIKSPENRGKPIDRLIFETGKIVIAGLTGVSAIILGEVIEKGLTTIPILAIPIPLIGSIANILGMLLGALVSGIIGAIAINFIEKFIEKKQKSHAQVAVIDKGNQILNTQHQLQNLNEVQLENNKTNAQANISKRHQEAGAIMKNSFGNIMEDFVEDFSCEDIGHIVDEEDVKTNKEIDKTSDDLDDLIASLM